MGNCLISKLNQLIKKYRFDEKILIVPDFNTGHQILQDLSKNSPGWINFKAATIGSLASEIAAHKLLKDKIEKISSIESNFIIDTVFTELAEEGSLMYFKKYIINTGIINAITAIIIELKMSGLSHQNIKSKYFIDPKKGEDIKLIFSGYQDFLKEKGLADSADIIAASCKILDDSGPPDSSIKYIVLSRYANTLLEREFIKSISGGSPVVIAEEEIHGLDTPKNRWEKKNKASRIDSSSNIERAGWLFDIENAPPPVEDNTISLFSGDTYQNELYELLGRITAEKIPLDRVEIIYTSSDPYLISLYNICKKLELPAMFSEGLPGDTSRPGMALKGFLLWINDGFAESHLRKLLKYSLIKVPGSMGPRLAHALRTSKIGWGRDRYSLILNKEIAALEKKIKEGGKDNYKRRLDTFKVLSDITRKLLEAVPLVLDGKVDFTLLCDGCIQFLNSFVKVRDEEEGSYLSNLKQSLKSFARIDRSTIALEEAVKKLLEVVSRLAFKTSGPRPGHLYISNLSTGGRSGRDNTYIVGMDSHKFPGSQTQDPVLLDGERERISKDIKLSKDRLKEKLYGFALMLAALKGSVTISYSTYDIGDERQMFPSSVYLQIYRLKKGNSSIDYQELLSGPGRPSGSEPVKIIDGTGWWMNKLTGEGSLKDARESVFNIYPLLRQGDKAIRQRSGSELTIYDGFVVPEGAELDPRKNPDMVLSCSAIETYAGNPYAFFLGYILKARRPEEIARDRLKWLDPAQRGSLLHEVFQLFSRQVMDAAERINKKEQRKIINKILDRVLGKYTEEVPVPGAAVQGHEVEILRRDLEVFLDINSKLCQPHLLEFEFGYRGKKPVKISIGAGSYIHVAGKIDRVDIDSDGNYHVWDYKTGSAYAYNDGDYIAGGRQVQHILYGKVIEKTLGTVVKSGYILPTERGMGSGKGAVFERDPGKTIWQEGLNCILDLMAEGLFIISEEENPPYLDDSDIYGTPELKKSIKNKIKDSGNELLSKWQSLKDYK